MHLAAAQDQGQNIDLQVEKIVTNNYSAPFSEALWSNASRLSELEANQTFYYLIRVTNIAGGCAQDIRIRDWLPYEVSSAKVLEPDQGVLLQDNLVQVDIPALCPNASKFIAIKAVSPEFAPATLYNYVYLTSDHDANQSNNRFLSATYIRPDSYTKQDSIASFEDLLRSQSILLSGFERLLNATPADQMQCYRFIASYEQLLRTQTVLFSRFQELLLNSSGMGWDPDLAASDQIDFLASYEDLLRREAGLYAGFQQKLNNSWSLLGRDYRYDPDGPGGIPEHNTTAQREFLASFEDLLRRQVALYEGFHRLENRLDESIGYDDRVSFLASFEDLLRRESKLLMGFEDLIMRLFLSI